MTDDLTINSVTRHVPLSVAFEGYVRTRRAATAPSSRLAKVNREDFDHLERGPKAAPRPMWRRLRSGRHTDGLTAHLEAVESSAADQSLLRTVVRAVKVGGTISFTGLIVGRMSMAILATLSLRM